MALSLQRSTATKGKRSVRAKSSRRVRAISPQNRQAIKLLQDWLNEPDDLGTAWWADFERELSSHRFTLRSG